MMVRNFIQFLHENGLEDLTTEEILDIFWLSHHLPPKDSVKIQEENDPETVKSRRPLRPQSIPSYEGEQSIHLEEQDDLSGLFLSSNQEYSDSKMEVPGVPFPCPTPPNLKNKRELIKALNPFRRKTPSRINVEFDDERTIKHIAEQHFFQVFTRPAIERQLEIDLVIEESESMAYWHSIIREFCHMMESTGMFRKVNYWSLSTFSSNEEPILYAQLKQKKRKRIRRQPRELVNYSGNRIVLLISDCVSSSWHNGKICSIVESWSTKSFLNILNLLPNGMQWRSGLRTTFATKVLSGKPIRRNTELSTMKPGIWPFQNQDNIVGIPIFSLEPRSIQEWAKFVFGDSFDWHYGVVFPHQSAYSTLPIEELPDGNDPKAILDSFRISSSKTAFELAIYLSAGMQLNLPVMRLIQNTMLPKSKYHHLVEVLLGGVIRPLKNLNNDETQSIEKTQFDFLPGVRGLLNDYVSSDLLDKIISLTTIFLERNSGKQISFQSILSNPSQASALDDNYGLREFARISVHTLRRYGGRYATLANQFTTLTDKTTSKEIIKSKKKTIDKDIQALLTKFDLDKEPMNPELAAAIEHGVDAVQAYLRAKEESVEILLNEAKLVLVGEGGVGKTSLLAALRGDPFAEARETTHGIELDIKSLKVKKPEKGSEITLNCWDFGSQSIYRHIHQLFFTAPAVYLVVWEPRRGPERCRVSEWIKMIKHRAYDKSRPEERPRILVVATHGGPKERLDHIDEQALHDEFGDLIAGFHHVDIKPNQNGICYGLYDLIAAIGREAAAIPSVGRTVPLSWKKILEAIRQKSEKTPYLHYKAFENLCNEQGVSSDLAATYAFILNELGYIIYHSYDKALKDIMILKPNYLSKAISFVLEDKVTREARGLVEHQRLSILWHNPDRPPEERYPLELHYGLLRLMTKLDISYQVVMPQSDAPSTSLITPLVPTQRSEGWEQDWVLKPGDLERTQICRILDAVTGRTVEAEGLMFRLMAILYRYSLGRGDYTLSRHWKTGMLLDDGYNGRAHIEEIGGDIYITVRAAYPERFLHQLCGEVRWLVENFWKGLEARLNLPCPKEACKGLLELDEIMAYKEAGASKVRCAVCRQFHDIDSLMATGQDKRTLRTALAELRDSQQLILNAQKKGFGEVRAELRTLMSQADEQYVNLLAWLSDPAKEGPRLFSFEPVNRSKFNPRSWTSEKFRLTLWCEHAQQPLPLLEGADPKEGVIEIELTRKWFKKAAPVLKVLTGTLSLILPVAASGLKLTMEEAAYKAIEDQLDFGQEIIDASLDGGEKTIDWLEGGDETKLDGGIKVRAEGSVLHELHAILKAKDPDFGGLKRVQNKRREFLWVHERFVEKY